MNFNVPNTHKYSGQNVPRPGKYGRSRESDPTSNVHRLERRPRHPVRKRGGCDTCVGDREGYPRHWNLFRTIFTHAEPNADARILLGTVPRRGLHLRPRLLVAFRGHHHDNFPNAIVWRGKAQGSVFIKKYAAVHHGRREQNHVRLMLEERTEREAILRENIKVFANSIKDLGR